MTDQNPQDSSLISYIDDSLILKQYTFGLISELKKYGFRVLMEDQTDSFFVQQSPAFLITWVQAELEEYRIPYTDKDVIDDTIPLQKLFNLQAVNLNCWFEISKLNGTEIPRVYFSSHICSDQVNGTFRRNPLSLRIIYQYKYYHIDLQDVYGLAGFASKKDASYIFDLFLNQYIREKKSASGSNIVDWHYDYESDELQPSGSHRLIEVK